MTGFTNREHLLSKMRNGEYLDWDIIIIGGGITGAGVLREARRRGYKAVSYTHLTLPTNREV